MKVGIIGSRNLAITPERIGRELPDGCTTIVSGGAKGVDTAARQYAQEHHIRLQEYLPDYERYGRRAPIVRNRRIVAESDYLLAFWDYRSAGTRNALLECVRQGKRFKIILLS